MKRIASFLLALFALMLLAMPAVQEVMPDFLSYLVPGVVLAFPMPVINLSGVAELFRPERIAQVITTTERYGTPVMDRFYPEGRRKPWESILVPIQKITSITRAVPLVIRGAQGIGIGGDSGSYDYIEPQPIKTFDALSATEYNNARLVSPMAVQQWADERIRKHLDAHRKTAEALAAQSLSGTVSFPIANASGTIVDDFVVQFGTPEAYTVKGDWTADATKISTIYADLRAMRQQLARKGFNGSQVLAGATILGSLMDKIQGIGNDQRIPARVQDDGGIRIGEFVLYPFDAEYYHPGSSDGSVAAGYKKALGDVEVMMYDGDAPWEFLRVRLDNFKLPADPGPLGIITELAKDGSSIEMFCESKPFPIPPVPAILRTDATAV